MKGMNRACALWVLLGAAGTMALAAWPVQAEPIEGPALALGQKLDVDTATAAELEALPGIGPSLAARIVEARPFTSVDDLQRVRGIGPKTVERLAPLVE